MKKWWWLWLLAAIFFANGIWQITHVEEVFQITTRDIPHEDIVKDFEDTIGLWADEQEFTEIEKLDIDCQIEDLLVETETNLANQQAFSTIFLTIHIYVDTEADADYLYTDYDEVQEHLVKALETSPYYKYVRTQTMNYYRADNENFMFSTSFDKSTVFRHGSTGVKQERQEKNTQKIAYEYAEKFGYEKFEDEGGTMRQYGVAQLTHFGVEKNSKEVYIEIELVSDHKEHQEAVLESLPARAEELYAKMMKNGTAVKYMKEKQADTLTIVFHVPWNPEMEDCVFQYEL